MNTTKTLLFTNSHFFIGVDPHLKNWKVTILTGGIELKTFSMNPAPLELLAYLQKNYPTASTISSTKQGSADSGLCGSSKNITPIASSQTRPMFRLPIRKKRTRATRSILENLLESLRTNQSMASTSLLPIRKNSVCSCV